MNVPKAIQKANGMHAAISITNRSQRCHEPMREHGCETMAGKNLYQLSARAFKTFINRYGYDLSLADT